MEAARARKTKLMTIQKNEEEAIKSMDDWHPSSMSRSESGLDQKLEKVSIGVLCPDFPFRINVEF